MLQEFNLIPFTIVLILTGFDVLTGFAKAAYKRNLNSPSMRDGLWHKSGTILLEAFAFICAGIPDHITGLPAELDMIYLGVSVYIIVMEIISILENICEINPNLNIAKLLEIYGLGDKKDED